MCLLEVQNVSDPCVYILKAMQISFVKKLYIAKSANSVIISNMRTLNAIPHSKKGL